MAADRAELERLIRAADAAGDGDAVRVLFAEMDKLGAQPAPQAAPTKLADPFQSLVDLPPGTTEARQAESQLNASRQPAQYAGMSFTDRIANDVSNIGKLSTPLVRGAYKAVNAVPTMAADFGVAIRNLFPGQNYELPSAGVERELDALIPLPNAPGARKLENLTSLVGGFKMPSATSFNGKVVPQGFQTAKQAAKVAQQEAAKRAIEEGNKRGVPVFADDVLQNSMLRRASVAAEQVPIVGTSAGRAAQNQAAQSAVKTATEKFSDEIADDIPVAIQKSMGRRLGQFKEAAGKLYDKVAVRLDPAGAVQTPTLAKVVQEKIAAEQKLGSVANKEVIALLEKYKNAPAGNFSMMREIRSQLGSDISDFYTGANKTIGAKGVGSLQAIKSALEADMRAFANSQGADSAKLWSAADSFYRTNIARFKEAGLRDLVKTTEPEKVWRYIVAQGGLKSRADKVFATLDNAGKQAVRSGLMKEAQAAATNPQGVFSPAKFAGYIDEHSNAVQTFFRGRELQEIKGLSNLMRTVQRAGQFAENPPTGQRVIPYLMGGAAVLEPTTTAAVAGGTLGFTKLLQTESGRNLLLMMSKTAPGSESAQRLAAQAAKLIEKAGPVTTQEIAREARAGG